MKKQIACPNCKGKGNIILTRKYDDYCGIGSVMCEVCGGTGLQEADMTNADRIRAMTDEEMVAWAQKQIGCGLDYFPCGVVCDGKCEAFSTEACEAKIMEWLQQPAEVDDER